MRNVSIIAILILFGALFAFSGCVQKPAEEEKITGIDGLVISFEDGMPPSSIDEEESFDIGVLIENKGTAKVLTGDAAVFIAGIVPIDYTIDNADMTYDDIKKSTTTDLEGAYIEDGKPIPGDSEGLYWTTLKYAVDISTGTYPVTFTAQSCYEYSTTSWTHICLATRSAIRDITGTPICEITGEKKVTNDAAPVQVSKVTEYTYGSAGFKAVIEIQDVGTGTVYDSAQEIGCQGLHRQYLNRVYIDEIKLGTDSFADDECNWITEGKKHYIKLIDGVRSLTCRKSSAVEAGIAERKMEIKLSYGYTDSIQTSMDINAVV